MDDLLPFGDIISGLGLELPKIINVNIFTEIIKSKLTEMGHWEKIRKYGLLLPILVAFAMSQAVNDFYEAAKEGIIYGGICFLLHDMIDKFKGK